MSALSARIEWVRLEWSLNSMHSHERSSPGVSLCLHHVQTESVFNVTSAQKRPAIPRERSTLSSVRQYRIPVYSYDISRDNGTMHTIMQIRVKEFQFIFMFLYSPEQGRNLSHLSDFNHGMAMVPGSNLNNHHDERKSISPCWILRQMGYNRRKPHRFPLLSGKNRNLRL